ncbi:MAG: hypothetical protein ABR956_11565, partial [Terracidiphilus sp.]
QGACLAQVGLLLLLPGAASAQIKTGDFSTSLNGTVSTGYTADYGNQTGSDHSWTVGGNTNLSGFFYSPGFLSYNANLYLNQSRANSDFQSISNASGVTVASNIFGGSRFPGSISYSRAIDNEGNYAVPGLANYVTKGNNNDFAINWNANLPDAPSFSASFILGNSQYSVYGLNEDGQNKFHSLNLHSGYRLGGFNMSGYYSTGGGHSVIPQVVEGQQNTETQTTNGGEGFSVSHKLPMEGSITAAANRSTWDTDYLGDTTSGTVDILTTEASLHPTERLYVSASANYSDNLSGQLIESLVAAGGVAADLDSNETSNSLDLLANANYSFSKNLQGSAFTERRTQLFLGESYGVTSYGGGGNYTHVLFNGSFNASVTALANSADKGGEDSLGFSTNENYSNVLLGWNVTGSFGYSQNMETLLVTYMNSFFNYSGNARRRWGKLNVSAGAGATRTGLTQEPGTVSSSQSYNASVGYGSWLSANGNYSKSSGQALVTGAGLVPVPIPSPTLPSNLVSLYGGDGYSLGLSSSPLRGLTLTASFAKSTSNISNSGVASANVNNEFNSLVQYQARKLIFTSGYSRLDQGFSGSGTPPEIVSSFYIGVSRWFNFF